MKKILNYLWRYFLKIAHFKRMLAKTLITAKIPTPLKIKAKIYLIATVKFSLNLFIRYEYYIWRE